MGYLNIGLNSRMPDKKNIHQDKPIVFITGNSRSGTTMMMRIMNNHSQVHSINEPHFFEKLWSPQDQNKKLSRKEAFDLYAKLFTGQRAGFFEKPEHHLEKYRKEIEAILSSESAPSTRMAVYAQFMHYEAEVNGKHIPCEKNTSERFLPEGDFRKFFPKPRS